MTVKYFLYPAMSKSSRRYPIALSNLFPVIFILFTHALRYSVFAHIRLYFPPAKSYPFDFLDNVRTAGPCGINQKTGPVTNIIPGSTINVTWHLGYPHQGGYRIELIDSENRLFRVLAPLGTNDSYVIPQDYTTQSQTLTIPADIKCPNCFLRLLRQAKEWTAGEHGYIFWSCADVNIMPGVDPCGRYGKLMNGKCFCQRKHFGSFCENYNDCENDEDCSNQGICVDLNATTFPSRVCFCNWGYLGDDCSKKSSIETWDFNPTVYNNRHLVTKPGYEFDLYWRVLPVEKDIEFVLISNSSNWMSVGWRPNNLRSKCQHYPVNLGIGGEPLYPPIIQKTSASRRVASGGIPVAEAKPESSSQPIPVPELAVVKSAPEPEAPITNPVSEPEQNYSNKKLPSASVNLKPEPESAAGAVHFHDNPKPESSNVVLTPISTNSPPSAEGVSEVIKLETVQPGNDASIVTQISLILSSISDSLPTALSRKKRQNPDETPRNVFKIPAGIGSTISTLAASLVWKRPTENVPIPINVTTTLSSLVFGDNPPAKVLDIAHVMKEMSLEPTMVLAATSTLGSNPQTIAANKAKQTIPSAEQSEGTVVTKRENSKPSQSDVKFDFRPVFITANRIEPTNIPQGEVPSGTPPSIKTYRVGDITNVPKAENTKIVAPIAEPQEKSATALDDRISKKAVALVSVNFEGIHEQTSKSPSPHVHDMPVPESEQAPKPEAEVPETNARWSTKPGLPEGEPEAAKIRPTLKSVPVSEEDLNNIATKGASIHPMDCLDVVIGMVSPDGYHTRINDFYSRDRSTPMADSTFGGKNDVTGVLGFRRDGTTTLMFRKKLMTSDLADHAITNDIMHVSWARGQIASSPIHNPPSGLEIGSEKDKRFYRDNELKYHGTSPYQRGSDKINFYDKPKNIGVINPGGISPNSMSSPPNEFGVNECGDMTAWKYPIDCNPSGIDCEYEAYWSLDSKSDLINFKIVSRNSTGKWTGLAFSKHRKMPNSDLIYGWVDPKDNTAKIFDGWIPGYSAPTKDVQQSISSTKGMYNSAATMGDSPKTILEFSRKRQTDDREHDAQFSDTECYYFFFPYEAGKWKSDDSITPHVQDPFVTANLICIRQCQSNSSNAPRMNGLEGTNLVGSAFDVTFKSDLPWKLDYKDTKTPEAQILINDIKNNIRRAISEQSPYTLADIQINKLREGSLIIDATIAANLNDPNDINEIRGLMNNLSKVGKIGNIPVVPNIIDIKSSGCYGQGKYYKTGSEFVVVQEIESKTGANHFCYTCKCDKYEIVRCQGKVCDVMKDLMDAVNSSGNGSTQLPTTSRNMPPTNPSKVGASSGSASQKIRQFFNSYWANRNAKLITIYAIVGTLVAINFILVGTKCYLRHLKKRNVWQNADYIEDFKTLANVYNINTKYARYMATPEKDEYYYYGDTRERNGWQNPTFEFAESNIRTDINVDSKVKDNFRENSKELIKDEDRLATSHRL